MYIRKKLLDMSIHDSNSHFQYFEYFHKFQLDSKLFIMKKYELLFIKLIST